MRLKWEKSAHGLNAVAYERGPIRGPICGGVAYKKAWDVDWVRAAFAGEWTGFEICVRLWIRDGHDAVGLTVLMQDYPSDGGPDPLPDVCIRWADWRGREASDGFLAADDKRQYVRDDLPLRCVLRFYRSPEIGIAPLMERTSALLAAGVSFTETRRPGLDRRGVTFEFCDGRMTWQFSWFPGSFASASLEQAVEEWLEYGHILEKQPGELPDDGFQIAYGESLWEWIARYEGA